MPTDQEIVRFIGKIKSANMIMTSRRRMRKLKDIFLKYKDDNNSFVECGVAKGGCLALMKYVSGNRKIWGFDSFDGMPKQTIEDKNFSGQMPGKEFEGFNFAEKMGEKSVHDTFSYMNQTMEDVFVVKGWFQNTLLKYKKDLGQISVLRIDCDWYESVKYCLNVLYDSLIVGGTVVIDDYNMWPGCKRAVDEFRLANNITSKVDIFPGGSEICWTK
jgi:O-methyltransferase